MIADRSEPSTKENLLGLSGLQRVTRLRSWSCVKYSTHRDLDSTNHQVPSRVANGLFAFAESPDMNLNGN